MVLISRAQQDDVYQTPSKLIADLIDTPSPPSLRLSPDAKWLLLLERPKLPSIEQVAQKELRLAGIRINPRTNGASRSIHYTKLWLRPLSENKAYKIKGLPRKAQIEHISWSPDSSMIAFTHTRAKGIELWIIDIANLQAKRLTAPILNNAMSGLPYKWFSDSNRLIYKSIFRNRGRTLKHSNVPKGPMIQTNEGTKAVLRTYQDLLRNSYDEELFTYYSYAELHAIDIESGEHKPLGIDGIISSFATSPDGQYFLVTKVKHPFSYNVPYGRFPFDVIVYRRNGKLLKKIVSIPMAEDIPQGFGAVRRGPRSIAWRPDLAATLYWVEALDFGDPKRDTAYRDQLYFWDAPFQGEPQKSIRFQLRYGGTAWGDEQLAISYEWWWQNRKIITSAWNPNANKAKMDVLFDRSWEDAYNDPGNFELERNGYGHLVLMRRNDGQTLYLRGTGASNEGNRPFVDAYDLSTKTTQRLWQSEAPYYEQSLIILEPEKGILINRRESKSEPSNYFIRNLCKNTMQAITQFEHPYELFKEVQRQLIRYKRADGIELTGTLYLPPHYDKARDGKLPVLMWAYPKEYKSKDAASQIKRSPYEFMQLSWSTPLFWVTQGYAIFNDFGMPIVGEGTEEPNETFIPQLQMSAEAAVKTLVNMGIADPNRIAVGGHSYGAFMTANLLAHTNLFAAGIARSGAYNRTLTPFGFQSEERTFWEAPEVYMQMSPFLHADKIKAPLLLIHGEADNNAGTYPMQSERLYNALKGQGATTRLVMLPHESHAYRARESVLHMLWEMSTWLDKYVKNKPIEMEN